MPPLLITAAKSLALQSRAQLKLEKVTAINASNIPGNC
jgi:hypothetical protein